MLQAAESTATTAAALLASVRARQPRVHCITNTVAAPFTANVLLAAGAVPSMTVSIEEVGAFVARADAALINLGTFDADRRAATLRAVDAAASHRRPFVLDPVFVDRSPPRAAFAREVVGLGPAAVRLNAPELATLFGEDETPAGAARISGAVVAVTGPIDVVADGRRGVRVANGHPLMAKITATGCAAGALVAAFLSVTDDAFEATAAALLAWSVAAEVAGDVARGPGSFVPALIDALHALDTATLLQRARVSA